MSNEPATVAVRYVGPHTEGVEVRFGADLLLVEYGEVVDLPAALVNGTPPVFTADAPADVEALGPDDRAPFVADWGTSPLLEQLVPATDEFGEFVRDKAGDVVMLPCWERAGAKKKKSENGGTGASNPEGQA